MGFIIDEGGIHADPSKVAAIAKFPAPQNVTELQRFLGMVNKMGRFAPNLTSLTSPLRELLRKDVMWTWDTAQQSAVEGIKKELCTTPTLAWYDATKPLIISADASSYGLGAALLQEEGNGDRNVVAYASRSKTDCESRYAQIEEEALALIWACDRFAQYVTGVHILLETDHKPLIPLLGQKLLDQLPLRVQCFRLKLMRYSYDITYVPGKNLHAADALSRAPIENNHPDDDFGEAVETYVESAMYGLQCNVASSAMMTRIKQAYKEDPVCAKVMAFCEHGWPPIMTENPAMHEFYQVRDELSVEKDFYYWGREL